MSAHDTALTVDGDLYWVRREFELIRRIEQAFGPLGALDRKLRSRELPAEQLVVLFRTVLSAQVSRPPDAELAEHVFTVGMPEASDQLALVVVQLFHGNRRAVALLEREAELEAAKRGAEGGADADPPRPAGSIGAAT